MLQCKICNTTFDEVSIQCCYYNWYPDHVLAAKRIKHTVFICRYYYESHILTMRDMNDNFFYFNIGDDFKNLDSLFLRIEKLIIFG